MGGVGAADGKRIAEWPCAGVSRLVVTRRPLVRRSHFVLIFECLAQYSCRIGGFFVVF